MSKELVILATESGTQAEYQRLDVASVAARQLVRQTGEPVTLRVYDVVGTSMSLKRRIRVIRRLDDKVVMAAT